MMIWQSIHTIKKKVSASLTHISFKSSLIHQVIWRTNIPYVCEREKGIESMQKFLQAYQVKTHCYTFCPHRIMVRHPQYVAYFSHRPMIKVLRTEKCTKCLFCTPLSSSHANPDVIVTDGPSSGCLQDHNLVVLVGRLWSIFEMKSI